MKWKKYLAAVLAAGVTVTALPTQPYAVVWAQETGTQAADIAQDGSTPDDGGQTQENAESYTASSAEELQECLNTIAAQDENGRGSKENPVSIRITKSFDVAQTINIPKETYVSISGVKTEGSDTCPTLTIAGDAKNILHVYGGLIISDLTLSGRCIVVAETGTCYMEEGTILQNGGCSMTSEKVGETTVVTRYGGGVTNYGTFVLDGGVIQNCFTSGNNRAVDDKYYAIYGGGVYNAATGTFLMHGGEITGNKIYAHGTDNVSMAYGSGVANFGTFVMDGGKIDKNEGELGAAVYNNGSMTLSGGSIQDNEGNSNIATTTLISIGSGIFNDYDGNLSMTGGKIQNNTAGKGAGVYSRGTFLLSGESALISGNKAQSSVMGRAFSCGGGVYVAAGTFTLESGTISKNLAWNKTSTTSTGVGSSSSGQEIGTAYYGYAAVGNGGGVYVANGGASFTMTGGTISNNVARTTAVDEDIAGQGGGVYVQGGNSPDKSEQTAVAGKFTMTGGSITANKAQYGGAGIYVGSQDYFVTKPPGNGVHESKDYTTYRFTGAASFTLGNSASISENIYLSGQIKEDICLETGTKIEISGALSGTDTMNIRINDKSEGAVLAVYSGAECVQESDAARFAFSTAVTDLRSIVLDSETSSLVLKKRKLDETTAALQLTGESFGYNGKAQEPEVTVMLTDGTVLEKDKDYVVTYENNTDAGTATVNVTGAETGSYTGSLSTTFTITPKDITDAKNQIIVKDSDLTLGNYAEWYTGREIKPAASLVTLNDGETGLQMLRGTDYVITYSDNVEGGTGKVNVTGIKNYTGTLTYEFAINTKSLKNVTVSSILTQTYTGAEIKPSVTVKDGDTVLKKDTDYTVSYTKNIAAGTANVTITGMGLYRGSKQTTFTIAGKSLSSAGVMSTPDQIYTGKAIKPSPAVRLGSTVLKKGTDYTLSYRNNTKTGKATITIRGTGNYSGTRTVTFRIVPKKAALKSVASKKKKQLTVQWKKDAQASGYQVMIATNAKFTKNKKMVSVTKNTTVTKTITGLKSGTGYYVAVRSYKTIDGKKVYGAWSSYQKKKVRK